LFTHFCIYIICLYPVDGWCSAIRQLRGGKGKHSQIGRHELGLIYGKEAPDKHGLYLPLELHGDRHRGGKGVACRLSFNCPKNRKVITGGFRIKKKKKKKKKKNTEEWEFGEVVSYPGGHCG
jgi:hypothetical protein